MLTMRYGLYIYRRIVLKMKLKKLRLPLCRGKSDPIWKALDNDLINEELPYADADNELDHTWELISLELDNHSGQPRTDT